MHQDLSVKGNIEIVRIDDGVSHRISGVNVLLRGQVWFEDVLVETHYAPARKRMLVHSNNRNVTGIIRRWSPSEATHGDHHESTRGVLVRKRGMCDNLLRLTRL